MNSRAQVSAEFLVLVGLAFLLAIGFAIASLDQLQDFRKRNEDEAIKDMALKLQKEFLLAANVEDGYIRVFDMPQKIGSINYTVSKINSTIVVRSDNSFHVMSIPSAVGNPVKGTNKINKTGGVIYIN